MYHDLIIERTTHVGGGVPGALTKANRNVSTLCSVCSCRLVSVLRQGDSHARKQVRRRTGSTVLRVKRLEKVLDEVEV